MIIKLNSQFGAVVCKPSSGMFYDFEEIIGRAFDYDEALERQNLKQEDVEKLRTAVEVSEFVPKCLTNKQVKGFARRNANFNLFAIAQLLLFLNAFKSDIAKSAEKLINYYKLKKETPEFFANRDLNSEAIQSSLDHQDFVALPVTPDNCNLVFHRLSSYVPKHYVFNEAVKTFIVTSGESSNRSSLSQVQCQRDNIVRRSICIPEWSALGDSFHLRLERRELLAFVSAKRELGAEGNPVYGGRKSV